MNISRRQFVVGTGAVLSVAGIGTSQVLADGHDSSLQIVEVNEVEEVVVIENTGDEAVDLEGYIIDWEYKNDDKNQTNEITEGVVEPGRTFTLWSGYESDNAVNVEYDYRVDEYGNGRIRNNKPDVIALLDPEGQPVTTSEDIGNDAETGSEVPGDDDADTGKDDNDSDDSGSEDDNSSNSDPDDSNGSGTEADNGSDVDSDDSDNETDAGSDNSSNSDGSDDC